MLRPIPPKPVIAKNTGVFGGLGCQLYALLDLCHSANPYLKDRMRQLIEFVCHGRQGAPQKVCGLAFSQTILKAKLMSD